MPFREGVQWADLGFGGKVCSDREKAPKNRFPLVVLSGAESVARDRFRVVEKIPTLIPGHSPEVKLPRGHLPRPKLIADGGELFVSLGFLAEFQSIQQPYHFVVAAADKRK